MLVDCTGETTVVLWISELDILYADGEMEPVYAGAEAIEAVIDVDVGLVLSTLMLADDPYPGGSVEDINESTAEDSVVVFVVVVLVVP